MKRNLTRSFFWLAYALLMEFALCAGIAHAASLEVGAGVAQAQTNGDGTWYQQAFPHAMELRAPVFLVGVTGDISTHVRWHADAVDLGSYSVNSWDTPNDGNYAPGVGYRGNALPLTNYIGSGHVWGFAATLEAHTAGSWQFGIEGGPFLYHATWAMRVPDWYPSEEVATRLFRQSGPVHPVDFSQSQWALGAVVGASVRHGAWTLSIRRYFDGHGFSGHGADAWPPLWNSQTAVMVDYTFD